jgi:Ankyrin repeats (3 copies)
MSFVSFLVYDNGINLEESLGLISTINVNGIGFWGHTPLLECCHYWDRFNTPLSEIEKEKRLIIAKRLIECGADVNLIGRDFRDTPIMEAIRSNQLELFYVLVQHGAHLYFQEDERTGDGENDFPLAIACRYNRTEIAKYIIESTKQGTNNFHDLYDSWYTVLGLCARNTNAELIDLLLRNGVNPDQINPTPQPKTAFQMYLYAMPEEFPIPFVADRENILSYLHDTLNHHTSDIYKEKNMTILDRIGLFYRYDPEIKALLDLCKKHYISHIDKINQILLHSHVPKQFAHDIASFLIR